MRWAPHLSATLNAKHAADTGPEVFPLCFILFPRHYILTLTSGCDKREAWNLATYPQRIPSAAQHRGLFRHSHTIFPPNRPRTVRAAWTSGGTMPGFKAAAPPPLSMHEAHSTLPIGHICIANDLSLRVCFPGRGLVFSLCFSVPPFLFFFDPSFRPRRSGCSI